MQCEESGLAMEREASLHCKEMALQRKENRVQRQMMSVMLMSLMQNNNAMSRMIGGIGAHMGVPPEQENINAYMGVPSGQEGFNLGQSANGDAANREAN